MSLVGKQVDVTSESDCIDFGNNEAESSDEMDSRDYHPSVSPSSGAENLFLMGLETSNISAAALAEQIRINQRRSDDTFSNLFGTNTSCVTDDFVSAYDDITNNYDDNTKSICDDDMDVGLGTPTNDTGKTDKCADVIDTNHNDNDSNDTNNNCDTNRRDDINDANHRDDDVNQNDRCDDMHNTNIKSDENNVNVNVNGTGELDHHAHDSNENHGANDTNQCADDANDTNNNANHIADVNHTNINDTNNNAIICDETNVTNNDEILSDDVNKTNTDANHCVDINKNNTNANLCNDVNENHLADTNKIHLTTNNANIVNNTNANANNCDHLDNANHPEEDLQDNNVSNILQKDALAQDRILEQLEEINNIESLEEFARKDKQKTTLQQEPTRDNIQDIKKSSDPETTTEEIIAKDINENKLEPSMSTPKPTPTITQEEAHDDGIKLDAVSHVYETAKNIWGWGKGVLVVKPFLGIAEGIAGKVVGVAGTNLHEIDDSIKPQVKKLDQCVFNPAVDAVVCIVLGAVSKTENIVKPIVIQLLKPLHFLIKNEPENPSTDTTPTTSTQKDTVAEKQKESERVAPEITVMPVS